MSDALFFYDASRQALVVMTPSGPFGLHVNQLEAAGWGKAADQDRGFRFLPRFGVPGSRIQVVGPMTGLKGPIH